MLLIPHTLTGIAIATLIPNPLIAAPLSFVMHFVYDVVPHWDFYTNVPKENRKEGWRPLAVMADLAIGVAIGTAATLYALWVLHDTSLALNVFVCGIASVLPDVLTGPWLYLKNPNALFTIMHAIQSKLQTRAGFFVGITTQVVASAVAILLLLRSIQQ